MPGAASLLAAWALVASSLPACLALRRCLSGGCVGTEQVALPRNESGRAVCRELERLPNFDKLPAPPAQPCKAATGEHCRGVLRLGGAMGDPWAGFSSTYGVYTINQLLLAEALGLMPFADYDRERAGSYWQKGQAGDARNAWEYYFGPVSAYSRGDGRFAGLPVCNVSRDLNNQLHYRQGWAVRSWGYGCDRRRSYEEIVSRSRPLGATVVKRYYRVRPEVHAAVEDVLGPGRKWGQQKVLGMHIRGSDKGNGREVVRPEAYLLPALAFVAKYPGSLIYLATDDEGFRDKVLAWPREVSSRVVAHPLFLLARTSEHPFGGKHFRREEGFSVLLDILALAKCDWLLHSISGVSEFAMYFNPTLQRHSTNLERNQTPSYSL